MKSLHKGSRESLEISPNLWAGVGLVRGGAGTALVGDADTVTQRMRELQDLGIDTFILSGYPHLEEAYRFAELVFPRLGIVPRTELGQQRRLTLLRALGGEIVANTIVPQADTRVARAAG